MNRIDLRRDAPCHCTVIQDIHPFTTLETAGAARLHKVLLIGPAVAYQECVAADLQDSFAHSFHAPPLFTEKARILSVLLFYSNHGIMEIKRLEGMTMSAKNNRDDFSAAVKRNAAMRVGYNCSCPTCGISTVGASLENDSKVS